MKEGYVFRVPYSILLDDLVKSCEEKMPVDENHEVKKKVVQKYTKEELFDYILRFHVTRINGKYMERVTIESAEKELAEYFGR